ncbi:SDR family NAD(P)-dependent oxidoreductase [Paenibacillus oenotherae]|uniref:SDR family NAD(P)-dependent oxidoreductase n=1 Tax=Paenibacillus oenotherae TaxID=1435645 RepID=A0ABS7D9M6_9BACL|nr:SDR family NAD(P)-dependent oxidoreductase [Paenibacillus oenotherae]MBW7476458.1 SDR family NAD(P)-dependent oxidoreductase [Paenibacillus oenotherae]
MNNMKTVIITGVSRGIGEAAACLLLDMGHRIIGIARGSSSSLNQYAGYVGIEADLGDTAGLSGMLAKVFERIQPAERSDGIYLVNNAAMLQPLRDAGSCMPEEIAYHMGVNLTAPMVLSALFARHTDSYTGDKRILNISSASAAVLLPGMSCYSTAKAGLDVFSKVMGMEQQNKPYPLRIASVWPGMIETELQAEVRNQPISEFESAGLFIGAKESGMLATPGAAAGKLVELLFSDAFPQGGVVTDLQAFPKEGAALT